MKNIQIIMYKNKLLKNFMLLSTIALFFYSCSKSDDDMEPYQEEPEELIDIYEPDNSFKVIGYFPYYRFSAVDLIDFSKLTYVNIAFGNLDSSGNLIIGNGVSISAVVQKIKNENVRVMLSIAGGANSDEQIANWVKYLSEGNRKNTIVRMVNFVENNNLDGIDVDIEGSLIPALGTNYNKFVIELRAHLHAKGKAITAALMPISIHSVIHKSTLEAFDFINIMAYNETGLWNIDNKGQHSSYEFAERSIAFWRDTQEIDSGKLVLGMPFYGINFDPSVAASITYGNLVAENTENAYFGQKEDTFYNGISEIVNKTILATEQVNGIMFWELGQDSFTALSLLSAASQTLDALPCEGSLITTFYADEDGDGYGTAEKPFQSCTQPFGYVDNRLDNDDTDPDVF